MGWEGQCRIPKKVGARSMWAPMKSYELLAGIPGPNIIMGTRISIFVNRIIFFNPLRCLSYFLIFPLFVPSPSIHFSFIFLNETRFFKYFSYPSNIFPLLRHLWFFWVVSSFWARRKLCFLFFFFFWKFLKSNFLGLKLVSKKNLVNIYIFFFITTVDYISQHNFHFCKNYDICDMI